MHNKIDSDEIINEFVQLGKIARMAILPPPESWDSPECIAASHGQTTEERYGLSRDGLAKIRELQKEEGA